MAVPKMNADIILGSFTPSGRYEIAEEDRAVLLRVFNDLEAVIKTEMGTAPEGPLRSLIPLAMRFTEQAGRGSFRSPKGNNPYNVMSSKKEGVYRGDNMEEEGGVDVGRPAWFTSFGSDRDGVKAFFVKLRTAHNGAWIGAWNAIRDGSSIPEFARGLRPKGKPHYLTRNEAAHIAGLSGRGREALNLLEIIFQRANCRLRLRRTVQAKGRAD